MTDIKWDVQSERYRECRVGSRRAELWLFPANSYDKTGLPAHVDLLVFDDEVGSVCSLRLITASTIHLPQLEKQWQWQEEDWAEAVNVAETMLRYGSCE